MTTRELLIHEINHSPDHLIDEYFHLFQLVKEKMIPIESFENSIASQDALKKNWDTPDEDEAWADL
jgi:hypothetical protein